MEWKFDMVLNIAHGGFRMTDSIMEELRERGCEWVSECTCWNGVWYPSEKLSREEHFRKDPIFVSVVRDLRARVEGEGSSLLSWKDRRKIEAHLVGDLAVVTVRVVVEIDDDEGKETVRVVGGQW